MSSWWHNFNQKFTYQWNWQGRVEPFEWRVPHSKPFLTCSWIQLLFSLLSWMSSSDLQVWKTQSRPGSLVGMIWQNVCTALGWTVNYFYSWKCVLVKPIPLKLFLKGQKKKHVPTVRASWEDLGWWQKLRSLLAVNKDLWFPRSSPFYLHSPEAGV